MVKNGKGQKDLCPPRNMLKCTSATRACASGCISEAFRPYPQYSRANSYPWSPSPPRGGPVPDPVLTVSASWNQAVCRQGVKQTRSWGGLLLARREKIPSRAGTAREETAEKTRYLLGENYRKPSKRLPKYPGLQQSETAPKIP